MRFVIPLIMLHHCKSVTSGAGISSEYDIPQAVNPGWLVFNRVNQPYEISTVILKVAAANLRSQILDMLFLRPCFKSVYQNLFFL